MNSRLNLLLRFDAPPKATTPQVPMPAPQSTCRHFIAHSPQIECCGGFGMGRRPNEGKLEEEDVIDPGRDKC